MTRRTEMRAVLDISLLQMMSLETIYEKYGSDAQIMKLGEEGAELAAAVLKDLNTKNGWNQIVEEMVDVYLMICQVVSMCFTEENEELFKETLRFKLSRAMERIEK